MRGSLGGATGAEEGPRFSRRPRRSFRRATVFCISRRRQNVARNKSSSSRSRAGSTLIWPNEKQCHPERSAAPPRDPVELPGRVRPRRTARESFLAARRDLFTALRNERRSEVSGFAGERTRLAWRRGRLARANFSPASECFRRGAENSTRGACAPRSSPRPAWGDNSLFTVRSGDPKIPMAT